MSRSPSLLRQPIAPILDRHGIEYRISQKGNKTWYNLRPCPICGQRSKFECGVSEYTGDDGKLVHGFKCQHDPDACKDYGEFLRRMGERVSGHMPNHVIRKAAKEMARVQKLQKKEVPISWLDNATFRRRLKANPKAMKYLRDRGMLDSTTDYFKIGMSREYYTKDVPGGVRKDALNFPIFNSKGEATGRYGYYNIPGVTVNPLDDNGWKKGEIETYYADAATGRRIVFVCEGCKDVWIVWQSIQGTELADKLLVISSTHGKNLPNEWRGDFWKPFDVVYLGEDADEMGETIVGNVLQQCGIANPRRARVPEGKGKDWTDYFKAGGTVAEFAKLLEQAPIATIGIGDGEQKKEQKTGTFGYKPIDICGAFHGGHLYYPVVTRVMEEVISKRDGEEKTLIVGRRKTKVVRSDGALLETRYVPAPPGTPMEDRLLELTDGTPIERLPVANAYASWEWESIQAYVNAKKAGQEPKTKPLKNLYKSIHFFLCNNMWLPEPRAHTVLALAAITTYVQAVFDAVPLLMVNGPFGSGKSELGLAMKKVCANSILVGQGSAAAVARIIDACRGFVILDDVEGIGKMSTGPEFYELIQGVKLSYKKSTAVKDWIDTKSGGMKISRLNLYGIKMINNTSGTDAILGSRMIHIQTRKRLQREIDEWEAKRVLTMEPPENLRNDLHTWAFANVAEVNHQYRMYYPQTGDRDSEIAAPLRVIADLINDKEVKDQLELYLTEQAKEGPEDDTPEKILELALRKLVIRGHREVLSLHLSLEAQVIAPKYHGQTKTTDIPVIAQPESVGRIARNQGWVTRSGKDRRARVNGVQGRILQIDQSFIDRVIEEKDVDEEALGEPKLVGDFCTGCTHCPYREFDCSIKRHMEASGKTNGWPDRPRPSSS